MADPIPQVTPSPTPSPAQSYSPSMAQAQRQVAQADSPEAYLQNVWKEYGIVDENGQDVSEIGLEAQNQERQAKVEQVQGLLDKKDTDVLGQNKEAATSQILGGLADTTQSLVNLGISIGTFVDEKLSGVEQSEDLHVNFAKELFPESAHTANKVLRGATQFLVPFSAATKGLGVVSAMGAVTKGALAGAATDFLAFEGHDQRLSDLVQSMPELQNPISAYLASDKDDSELEGRLKNVIEGALTGVGVTAIAGLGEMIFKGVKHVKQARTVKSALETGEEVVPKVAGAETAQTATKKTPKIAAENIPSSKEILPEEVLDIPVVSIDKGGGHKLNLERIDAKTDILGVMQSTAKLDKDALLKRIGDTTTEEQIRQTAKEFGTTEAEILAMGAKDGWTPERLLVARELHVQAAEAVHASAVKARRTGSLEDKNIFMNNMTRFRALNMAVTAGKAEAGRLLQSLKIPAKAAKDPDQLAKFLQQNVDLYGARNLDNSINAIADGTAQTVKDAIKRGRARRLFDAIQEARVGNMLAGIQTQTVNALGTPFMMGKSVLDRALAPYMGAASKTGSMNVMTEFDYVVKGEAFQMIAGFWDGLMDATQAMMGKHKSGKSLGELGDALGRNTDPEAGGIGGEFVKAISSKSAGVSGQSLAGGTVDMIGAVARAPLSALSFVDNFWKVVANRGEQRALAYRVGVNRNIKGDALNEFMNKMIKDQPEQLVESGKMFAQFNTFTNPLEGPSMWFSQLTKEEILGVPMLKLLFPFTRVPLNINSRVTDMIPGISNLKMRFGSYHEIMAKGGAEAQLLKSRILLGNSMFAGAGVMAYQGLITGGGPRVSGTRKMSEEIRKPYSVTIGDTQYPLKLLGPFGTAIGLAADIAEIGQYGYDEGDTQTSLAALLSYTVLENSTPEGFIQTMGSFWQTVRDKDASLFTQIASQVPPGFGMLNNARRVTDPLSRDVDPDIEFEGSLRDLQEVVNRIRNQIPGLSDALPPKRNIFADEVILPTSYSQEHMSAFFTGAKPKKNDPLMEELVRLGDYRVFKMKAKPGETHLNIEMPSRFFSMKGARVELSHEQYDRFVQLAAGKDLPGASLTLREKLEEIVLGDEYKDNTDEFKRLYIRKVIKGYRDAAKEHLLSNDDELADRMRTAIKQRGVAITGDLDESL